MTTQRTRIVATAGGKMSALAAALALVCAMLPAHATKESAPTKQLPPPEVARSETSAIVAVDAALRAEFKEYVGLSLEKEGTVLLTFSKSADLDAAANLAREVWMKATRRDLREHLPHFEFAAAAASPEELKTALARMRDVLTIKDVVFLDLDEACGCISVGIASSEAVKQIAYFAVKLDIPANWVKTVVAPRIIRTLDLTDEYRPTMGGTQIQTGTQMTCSLGLPTYSFARQAYGFLTASHCTEGPQGEMQSSWLSQRGGRWFWGDKIGEETLDLPLFDSSTNAICPTGRKCRWSDAAFADYSWSTLGITGRVKRPTTTCTGTANPCGLNVTRETDDIRMIAGISGLFTGTNVDKVGRTSGWTRGAITNTCADINVSDQDAAGNITDTMMTMLCQVQVATTSLGGDSGSPVFEYHPTMGAGSFAGILWGGAIDGNGMVYSPIHGIEQDLGIFVYNQAGLTAPFHSNGKFYTSNVNDSLDVLVEKGALLANEVEFVLKAGTSIVHNKEIVLVEGAAAGTGRWTIAVGGNIKTAANGLYLYQLPGGFLEFRKQIGNSVSEVSRIPIDSIPGGTRLTFTWTAE